MYDVVIIGCGIVGAATAYELSKYQLKVLVLEAEDDVSMGQTKANSAIVHAGYDPEPGTLMATLNVKGCAMAKELCEKLSVHYKNNGSLVVAFSEKEMETVHTLYNRGVENGVPNLQILNKEELLAKEPNLSTEAVGALYAPSAGIVNPWELCIALAEVALENGVELVVNSRVTNIEKTATGYRVETPAHTYDTRYVFNAAGVHSDEIHDMVAAPHFQIIPCRGEYYIMDKSEGERCSATIFQCPSDLGKGVLVSPTVHGNLIVGPDAVDIPKAEVDTGEDTANTAAGLEYIGRMAKRSIPSLDYRQSIRNFSGVRANSTANNFVIEEAVPGFIDLAAIKSPGLTSAPAIAQYGVDLLMKTRNENFVKKEHYTDSRKKIVFKDLSNEDKNALIQKDPAYGHVICRCETITEGEIRAACHSPITPVSIDGIKRRCNAGMGRCQSGFCGPRVVEILAEELGKSPLEIYQDKKGSNVLVEATKGGVEHA